MIHLHNQEQFEELISKNPKTPHDPIVIVYFTAKWCGPCNRLNLGQLLGLSDKIKWYLCDVDDNEYTPGYCNVKGIPCFMPIIQGKPYPLFVQSDTQKVEDWIRNGFKV